MSRCATREWVNRGGILAEFVSIARESYITTPPKHKKLGWSTLGVLSRAPADKTEFSSKAPAVFPATAAYCNFVYSALACFRMGMSGSASFQRVRKF